MFTAHEIKLLKDMLIREQKLNAKRLGYEIPGVIAVSAFFPVTIGEKVDLDRSLEAIQTKLREL